MSGGGGGGDILKEWLVHQLGAEVRSLRPDYLCAVFRNGVLIGELLRNYQVVDEDDCSRLVDRHDEATKQANFAHIKSWLTATGVVALDNDTVDGITSGRWPATIGFLYRLCFALENPNELNLAGCAGQAPRHAAGTPPGVPDAPDAPVAADGPPGPRRFSTGGDSWSARDRRPRGRTDAFHDRIAEFERGLPGLLANGLARGDRSCVR